MTCPGVPQPERAALPQAEGYLRHGERAAVRIVRC
jgi:hypothetical protein